MEKSDIYRAVGSYLAGQYFCDAAAFERAETVFVPGAPGGGPHIQILAFKESVVVAASKALLPKICAALAGKSRDEIFEFPFVYGQTIHYVPDLIRRPAPPLPGEFCVRLLEGEALQGLAGIRGFDNSLAFDAGGSTDTQMVVLAEKDGEIVALAGAAPQAPGLWEVGVDVKPGCRRGGVATGLVSRLTDTLMARGIVPFYSASVTNIASQMVAARSGYIPWWVDTYGTVLDGSSPYGRYVNGLVL